MSDKTGVLLHIIIGAQQADAFQQIFQNIKAFTETATLYFEEGRLFMQTMDSSHVSVVECVLPSTWFQQYYILKRTQISVHVLLFSKVIAARDKGQDLVLQMMTDSNDTLSICMQQIDGPTHSICNKSFSIPLFELDTELLQIPETEYDAEFALSSTEFAELIQQLRIFGDTLDIACSETDIVFHSVSQDKGKMRCQIDIEKLNSYSIVENEIVKSSFSIKYLTHVCAFHKLSPNIDLRLKADMPIQLTYVLPNVTEVLCDNPYLRFYLAPKIGDDDDEERDE